MRRKIFAFLLVVSAITLGFIRDHIFVSLNYAIESGQDAGGNLVLIKWALTLLFSILYLINTCALLYVFFKSFTYIRIAVYSYTFLFIVSLTAGLLGVLFSTFQNIYPFIRTVLGIAQSPVVMMILVSACYFDKMILKKSQ